MSNPNALLQKALELCNILLDPQRATRLRQSIPPKAFTGELTLAKEL